MQGAGVLSGDHGVQALMEIEQCIPSIRGRYRHVNSFRSSALLAFSSAQIQGYATHLLLQLATDPPSVLLPDDGTTTDQLHMCRCFT